MQPIRVNYPHWGDAVRDISVKYNSHKHAPYSKTGTVSANTTLDEDNHTVSATTTGLTITLPAANSRLVGQDWTVHLGTTGSVTIAANGSDTICTSSSATDTSVVIATLGDSLTFRCASSTSWILV